MDDPDHIEENFREYLNKFSANVRDILEKFKFDGHITTMANKGILYIVLRNIQQTEEIFIRMKSLTLKWNIFLKKL